MTVACGGTSIRYAQLEGATVTQPSGLVLDVTALHGACDVVLPTEVVETPTEVRLRVPLRVDDGDCEDIGLFLTTSVTLDQPLGGRAVVDDERQRSLPVRHQ